MNIFRTPEDMQAWALARRSEGTTIGLVPTMGFLHEGHLSLMRLAGQHADTVAASIFVNPTQFGPNEDLASYPRDFERDARLAEEAGVSALFAPTPESMYPPGFQTEVQVQKLTRHLCGKTRPTHFAGVATVVSKLFHIALPHVACFGEKDFQQLAMIRRMVQDMNMPIRILGGPIVREADGLAMSSRNTYLSASDRQAALSLSSGLALARKLYANGERDAANLVGAVETHILAHAGTRIDYVSLVDGDTLEEQAQADENSRLVLAVFIGKVRLIDNSALA